ncbi:unnamed protein product [Darwinula stevensoni]|uniref:DJ-1/PfpI domain-containing protein n=1 Tax=Darwinula stevensoni TaxID=69355 RepID=A0A7R9FTA3_9CRUS|nr:unnamed protein product [Darwinula stevensoni]CAG0905703.1 unnamed protein product [Darwinula stevensoni]
MLVPMLHFEKAGFEMEIYTPTGAPVQIEMWAFPHEDTDVQRIYRDYKAQFEQPKNLHDFVANDMAAAKNYAAIFIPGGHGAMLGLPENQDVKKLLLWTQQQDLMMCAICHGPAALLAAAMGEDAKNFMYRGYKMTAFPDAADRQTPLVGYMPGHLTWAFGKCLQDLGVEIVNKKADASVLQDRNLVTGASPKAANAFGKLATQALLKKENKQTI